MSGRKLARRKISRGQEGKIIREERTKRKRRRKEWSGREEKVD